MWGLSCESCIIYVEVYKIGGDVLVFLFLDVEIHSFPYKLSWSSMSISNENIPGASEVLEMFVHITDHEKI